MKWEKVWNKNKNVTEESIGDPYLKLVKIIKVLSLKEELGNVPALCHCWKSRVMLEKRNLLNIIECKVFSAV